MKPTQQLHDLGQSLWLDNITRRMLGDGTLEGYIRELSVTGLTSNPTIFDNAIKNSAMYDADIASAPSSATSKTSAAAASSPSGSPRAAWPARPRRS